VKKTPFSMGLTFIENFFSAKRYFLRAERVSLFLKEGTESKPLSVNRGKALSFPGHPFHVEQRTLGVSLWRAKGLIALKLVSAQPL
jgi:hypothetical protein